MSEDYNSMKEWGTSIILRVSFILTVMFGFLKLIGVPVPLVLMWIISIPFLIALLGVSIWAMIIILFNDE